MEDDFAANESWTKINQQQESFNVGKQHARQNDSNYNYESNAAVVILSGNKRNIGTIIDVNHEIQEILGYEKKGLIGENISLVMPEVIGVNHNAHLEAYFERQESSNINEVTKKLIFGQHSEGYIVPCSKLVRIVPNLENGVQFLGFLSVAKNLADLGMDEQVWKDNKFIGLILDKRWDILGFNENVRRMVSENRRVAVNFKKYLENEQKINLHRLYPDLLNSKEQLEYGEGLNTIIDLTLLKNAVSGEIIDTYEECSESIPTDIPREYILFEL